jgi:hypothetical protein
VRVSRLEAIGCFAGPALLVRDILNQVESL